jgi:hypothetical protein
LYSACGSFTIIAQLKQVLVNAGVPGIQPHKLLGHKSHCFVAQVDYLGLRKKGKTQHRLEHPKF